MVDEEILAFAALRGDESVPLRVVEPLHCSSRHKKTPPLPLMNGRWEASPTRYSLCGELSVAAPSARSRLSGRLAASPTAFERRVRGSRDLGGASRLVQTSCSCASPPPVSSG